MPNTMHSFENSTTSVPAFLVKLWKLVEDPSCNDLIAWSEHGTSFIIRDQTKFSKELLPQYFKHNNMASFIRQLNMYGFRKVVNYEKSSLRNENDEMEFMHTFFCKGQYALLELIKRKISGGKVPSEPAAVKSNPKDILTDLSSIREKQQNMDNMLLKMKQENELLWRELSSMRQKHAAQEQIIKKVVQFLVSIVQQSNQNIGVQRKMARMLQDSPSSKGNSQVACAIDVLRNKIPNFITVDQDKIVSPLGPVIHEVTEFEHEPEENPDSPVVKSPEEKPTENTESVPENETQESECPMNSSLNSPIDTSANMEPLSILESLQSTTPILNVDGCSLEESVLGLPFECLTDPEGNLITITSNSSNNVISLPDASSVGLSYNLNISPSDMIVYSTANSNYDDLMSESLQTPKIPTIHIEDVCPSPPKVEEKKDDDILQQSKTKSNVDSEHNYQLALADPSSIVKSSTLTKNTLSNHLLNVEEELNWLQDKITSKTLNIDPSELLGLFSTDDTANNEALAGEFAAQTNIQIEPNDIVGNELVQFTPSMLGIDLDSGNNQFLECLNQAVMSTETDNKTVSDQKNYLLVDVLNNTDQEAASEAAEYLLNNASTSKHKAQGRSKTAQRLGKVKRRKIK